MYMYMYMLWQIVHMHVMYMYMYSTCIVHVQEYSHQYCVYSYPVNIEL